MENFPKIPETHKKALLAMLNHLHNLFKENNIIYSLDGGGNLGLIRHNGHMIPWDDDLDLLVFDKQWLKMLSVLPQLKDDFYQMNYTVNQNIVKVFIPNMWGKIDDNIIGTPTIDIFKWKKSNGLIELENKNDRKIFKNCFYKKDELFPLKLYDFEGLKIYAPNDPKPYLRRYYGNDYLTNFKYDKRREDSIMEKESINLNA